MRPFLKKYFIAAEILSLFRTDLMSIITLSIFFLLEKEP